MVLGALTILTVMLTEFQGATSAELSSAVTQRDALKAEYAAKSAINLARLLIAAEPTIRKPLSPLLTMAFRGAKAPQLPVWKFADRLLGAFNGEEGTQAFSGLTGVNMTEGRNLGLPGASFEVEIIDEDSKINVNAPARGGIMSQQRLAEQLIGLMGGPQYDPLFEQKGPDGKHSDRRTICGAIIDWTDPDQDANDCDPHGGGGAQLPPEDSYYQRLDKPYGRANTAFDSLEELRLVRGVGDDFWATFVDPDPDSPNKRVVTAWGQGLINVNTANPQTLLAIVCSYALPGAALCNNPEEIANFLTMVGLAEGLLHGLPKFGSPKVFSQFVQGKGPMFQMVSGFVSFQPVSLRSEAQLQKSIATESKVFSIYATGVVHSGKRETRVRVHAVVDFRAAPPPGAEVPRDMSQVMAMGPGMGPGTLGPGPQGPKVPPTPGTPGQPDPNLPPGATPDALAGLFRPDPGGHFIYFRIE